ncbi:MAG: hypothetical protein LH475_06215, partial [Cryobacterium sp.]|nr:hypothetical protein [Cryobacterium sp.]
MPFASLTPDELTPFRIIFVCTGNICRSPMAEVVLRDLVTKLGLGRLIATSSAGTGDWHVGEQADGRTITALAKRGYDGSHHRARQFDPLWFAAPPRLGGGGPRPARIFGNRARHARAP